MNSCGNDVLRKVKISGMTHRRLHLLSLPVAVKIRIMGRMRFTLGSESQVRVRKKMSVRLVAPWTSASKERESERRSHAPTARAGSQTNPRICEDSGTT